MQNWNEGKTQEYKDRKEYVVGRSVLKHAGPVEVPRPESREQEVPVADAAPQSGRPILFATPTCPNCRIACSYMDKAGFAYDKLYADEHAELANQFGVKQAPTLIVPHGDSFEKIAGAGAIKAYVTRQ